MDDFTRSAYMVHTLTRAYRNKITHSKQVICDALSLCHAPYVAFSGGKDSAVLLHLVLQLRPDIESRTLVSGETRQMHAGFDGVMQWWQENFPSLQLSLVEVDRVYDGTESDWYTQRKAGRSDILKCLPTSKHDLVFLGLRDDESNIRRRANAKGAIRRYALSRRVNIAGKLVCTPISKWMTNDVGAYIVKHDIPMFDEYESFGFEARTTLRLTGDAARQGAFRDLRERDPKHYNELLKRFPELHWWNG